MTKGAPKGLLLMLQKCVSCDIINSQINKNLSRKGVIRWHLFRFIY